MENSFSLTPKGKINEILRSIRSDGGVSSGLDWAISQTQTQAGPWQIPASEQLRTMPHALPVFNVQPSPLYPFSKCEPLCPSIARRTVIYVESKFHNTFSPP